MLWDVAQESRVQHVASRHIASRHIASQHVTSSHVMTRHAVCRSNVVFLPQLAGRTPSTSGSTGASLQVSPDTSRGFSSTQLQLSRTWSLRQQSCRSSSKHKHGVFITARSPFIARPKTRTASLALNTWKFLCFLSLRQIVPEHPLCAITYQGFRKQTTC